MTSLDRSSTTGNRRGLSVQALLAKVAAAGTPTESAATLVSLFEAQAAAAPDSVAVVFEASTFTYAELNRGANRLARVLLGRGVAVDDVVAVSMARSPELIVALLAVLKSGAAYLPIDPGYPATRIADILADAEPALLLCAETDRVEAVVPTLSLGRSNIESFTAAGDSRDITDAERTGRLRPANLAYVVYTSGSTGRPKGVGVAHHNVVNLCRNAVWGHESNRCVPAHSSVSFDAAAYEMWAPLASGGTVVFAPAGVVGPAELSRLAEAHDLSTLFVTTRLFELLVEQGGELLGRIGEVWTGGENMPAGVFERAVRQWPDTTFVHVYGPTETTVFATAFRVSEPTATGPVPIGGALSGVRAVVLDEWLRPVARGVAGELYLAGTGVARGYRGRADLTSARFVADPLEPGGRMYRTGDVVRWNRFGELDYVGRSDFQVKVRGFRIEPGDVEAALTCYPGVTQAAVLAREIAGVSGTQLVAYVVGGGIDIARLRSFALDRLPEFMIPAAIVVLDRLPLTPNGKLDRAALPEPEVVAAGVYREPETDAEHALAAIFAEVLGVERVGADDSFFELGGHSLSAMRVLAAVRVEFDVDLPVRVMFEAQSVTALAARLTEGTTPRVALSRRVRPDVIPLSFAQQRLWFLHRMQGPSATYNMPFAIRLTGTVDIPALCAALTDVVVRHETLRTVFGDVDGIGVQRVLDQDSVRVPVEIIEADGTDPEATVTTVVAAAAAYAFDLTAEIPIRATIIDCGAREYVLTLVVHHIAGDGASMVPLVTDVLAAYAARRRNTEPQWMPLPVQYADYTLWQREALGEPDDPESVISQQIAYWRAQLSGLPEVIELPLDRPRPAVASNRGDIVGFTVPAPVRAQLENVARAQGVTVSMVTQAALAVLLSRMGAGTDIAIGAPIAGRTDEAVADLVGFFVNTWVLRVDTSGNPGFHELLARVKHAAVGAYTHQDAPFERLVEVLNPIRSASHHPLFQVSLAFQNTSLPDAALLTAALPELTVEPLTAPTGTARYDLLFNLGEHGDGAFDAWVEYATDLFDRSTVEQLAARYVSVLEQVAADPRIPLTRVRVIDTAERDLLARWNDTAQPWPVDATVVGMVEDQLVRTPDAIAVVHEGTECSYRQLHARANRLARRLIEAGVGPDAVVAVAVERSIDLIVAQLAVLKAGGAFLPIDLEHPAERIAYMLGDAAPVAVVTTSIAEPVLPAGPLPRILLDPGETADAADEVNLTDLERRGPLRPADLAYVFYTSGSTGRPKGVAVPHRGVTDRLRDQARRVWGDSSPTRLLAGTSVSFDVAVWEFFMPLCLGGSLEIIRDLLAVVERAHPGCGVLYGVPSAFAEVLAVPNISEKLPDIEVVVLTGEALPRSLVERTRAALPGVRVLNGYGPTEVTICASVHEVGEGDGDVPIGRPIGNQHGYVLDEWLCPVPVGVAGELYIGGPGLSRGYLGRPGLTAGRFVADPFGPAGQRLYRSGDVVRWTTRGVLEYLGRVDDQVKVRGFRIELGEVEATLSRHPSVAQSVVMAYESVSGTQLVGYVIADPAEQTLPQDIRRFAAGTLPGYMVPAAVVVLEQFPLTPNGKLDRAGLPTPDISSTATYRAPSTDAERALTAIFAEVLGADRVGIDDSFFELGGHSLSAMRVLARVRSVLGVELSVRVVFEAPTVAELALRLGEGVAARARLMRRERPAVVPLSFAQQRLWFLHRLEGPSATYNMPFAVRLSGAVDLDAMRAALTDVAVRHEALRTIFVEVDGVGTQRILDAATISVPVEIVDAVGTAESAAAAVATSIASMAAHRFDLATEIPIRAEIIDCGAREFVLAVVVHHIAADGASMVPLVTDVLTAYAARLSGTAPAWSPLPVQYADYTLWQRELLGMLDDPESVISEQVSYWRRELDGVPEVLELPADRPRPAVASYRGEMLGFTIPASVRAGLEELARGQGVTVSMVTQAALAALLTRLGAGPDIAIGTPMAGRTDDALNALVGFFVNTWVLRVDTSGDPEFADLLGRVREKALAAYGHQDLPFEQLVSLLNPVRSAGHHPLFQVMLAFQNNPAPDTDLVTAMLPGLTVAPLTAATHTARFDLWVNIDASTPAADGFVCGIEYATDLFDEQTIEAFAARYVHLLEQAAADHRIRLSRFEMMDAAEQRLLLESWNGAVAPVDGTATLVSLFEARVRMAPDAVAIVSEDVEWSYAQVNSAANRLARVLLSRGVAADDVVAVAAGRSAEMVVALLAILKAGAAYLPLDYTYPAERLSYILADAAPALLLTTAAVRVHLPETGVDVMDIGSAGPGTRESFDVTDAERAGRLCSSNLAYVIYTSGSTGRPKGVAVQHRNVVNLAANGLWDRHTRVLVHSSVAFDASTYEMWVPLLAGGALVLSADRASVRELDELIAAQRVSALWLTARLFEVFVEERSPALARVDEVWAGGEQISGGVFERARALWPSTQFVNGYGPTETTVFATSGRTSRAGLVPIGVPMPNVRAFVLDEHLHLVPQGVSGELYIAGAGVARGYRGHSDLTASRFVANPFGSGDRVYRTGDVVRWNRFGELEYVGRSDFQVKVRGFRIEPGEIEAVLLAHPSVAQAAVITREIGADGDSGAHLLGYVVLDADHAELREDRREAEQVTEWQRLYDELYAKAATERTAFGADFSGWNSSYTGAPIPLSQMREWRAATVARIRALHPARILEVGVGSGLLLAELAPQAAQYWATDFSAETIATLRAALETQSGDWTERVTLSVQAADVVAGLPPGGFDTIVINSVLQYFPSAAYLTEVIDKLFTLLAPGGRLFLGDIRNLALLTEFSSGVQVAQAGGAGNLTTPELRDRVRREIQGETELLVSPEYFVALSRSRADIGAVDIRLKQMGADNELSRYRYEAVLWKHPDQVRDLAAIPAWHWPEIGTVAGLFEHLAARRPDAVRIRDVAHALLHHDAALAQALRTGQELTAAPTALTETVVPESIRSRLADAGYELLVTWAHTPGCVDLVLVRSTEAPLTGIFAPAHVGERLAGYVSDPAAVSRAADIRRFAADRLPEFMVPAAVVVLDRLPLTANGKLDRSALPDPEVSTSAAYREPVGGAERVLAEIFAEVLGADRVGADDSFFELGGHSLSAMRVLARVRTELGVELSVRMVFETPTVAGLAARLGEGAVARVALTRRERPAVVPLSFAQQRLWFLHRLEGPSATYNMPFAVRLSGPLDLDAMRSALTDVAVRHEALRTVFAEIEGVGAQRILDADTVRVPVESIDATTDPGSAVAAVTALAGYAFDLTDEIPLRAAIIDCGAGEYVLAVVIHHIAGDGASMLPLVTDVLIAYAARQSGAAPVWSPLPVQYADYTLWQRELLGDPSDPESVACEQVSYWRQELDGVPEVLELPADRIRPAIASHRGDLIGFTIPAALRIGLEDLARRRGVTPAMVAQAALAALLSRLGAGTDIAIGAPIAGRTDEALSGLVGFFVNTWVLRVDIAGDPEFGELLARVKDKALAAYTHQDLPFEQLVSQLNPARSAGHHPLFQVMLAFQNNPAPGADLMAELLPGLSVSPVEYSTQTARFDMWVNIDASTHAADGYGCTIEYATDLFDRETMVEFAARYVRILERVVADIRITMSQLEVTGAPERQLLLEAGRGIDNAVDGEATLVSLFEARAAADPDAVALVFEDVKYTYGQVNSAANRLARVLLDKGVRVDDVVAVVIGRSPELIIALVATLKAGAAYLPVDPTYPGERIALILADAAPALLITTDTGASALPPTETGIVIVGADAIESGDPVDIADAERSGSLCSSNLAYVIYTSGSTGHPKGVAVQHRNVVNLSRNGLWDSHTRVLLHSSVAFDASTYEIWAPLSAGGTLVISPDRAGVRELGELIAAQRVSALWLTARLLEVFVEERTIALAGVREIWAGGERIPDGLFERARDLWPGVALVNGYGPTETTVFATAGRTSRGGSVPIGVPVPNARLVVLDEWLRLVPRGVPGELYIAGAGVARGYRGRSGLTAARFVADPFGTGGRMYRTGDVVRWNRFGELEYVGRSDFQVKVRGFRIEPGEIEGALLGHPAVAQAAVITRELPGTAEQHLVGYLVAAEAEVAAVRSYLGERLPEFMIPSALVALDRLPLTANGKLDRAALPMPEFVSGIAYRAPSTAAEHALVSAFADILGVDRVGVDDSFFELGGHSLSAMRVLSRIRAELGVELPVRMIFETSTPAGLAARLHEGTTARAALARRERPELIPLSFAQQRLWFLYRLDGPSPTYNMPFAVRLTGSVDVAALRDALTDVVARHEVLRTIFAEVDGVGVQRVLDSERTCVPVEVVDASTAVSIVEFVAQVVAGAAAHAFDLATEIPVRATIIDCGAGEYVLAVVVHHIAGDGTSMVTLVADVLTAYAARQCGTAPVWAPLPVQYADYTLWQRELLGELDDPESVISEQVSYWRDQLAGLPEVISLPLDRPRPAVATYQGATVSFSIPAPVRAGIERLAREHGVTVAMATQAALAVLLSRLGAGTDIALGAPMAGRNDEALAAMVGFFVNNWVLRVDTSGDPEFSRVLARVKEKALAAYTHQDVPFEQLVGIVNPVRSAGHHPLFQVSLAFQNNATITVDAAAELLPGLTVTPVRTATHTARFDLVITIDASTPVADGFSCGIEYATDLFDRETIDALAQRYVRVLGQVSADASTRMSQLDVLDSAERSLVLDGWNDTRMRFDSGDATLTALFEAQAAATPDAVAVVFEDAELTYTQLNSAANRFARKLLATGVAVDDVVAVAAPRSPELIIALLAVHKAGAAYLPIDAEYPADRIAHIIGDAAPTLVIATGEMAGALAGALPVGTTSLIIGSSDHEGADSGDIAAHERAGVLRSSNLAYLIYTSGSTGRPKGVAVEHRSVVNRLLWMARQYGVNTADVVLQKTPITFDVSVWELFLPLITGARLVLAVPGGHRDPAYLAATIRRERVTTVHFVPSMLAEFLNDLPGESSSLRQIIASGEALPVGVAQRARTVSGATVHNLYGPTEAAVDVTYHQVGAADALLVPIGRPVANTGVYVLDDRLCPVAPGVAGELYLAGVQLARGYRGRADLTAERFVADPFGTGARLYRTGDVVRWTRSGELVYLGRSDFQVKVRGLRIEPGEIETALLSYPGIAQAAVIARATGESGDPQLIGYVVPGSDAGRDGDREQDLVGRWQQIYDSVYSDSEDIPQLDGVVGVEFGADFRSWNSSYTRQAIPLPDMHEWRDATVASIESLRPRRVLEVGVGSGLLLSQIAPKVREYHGTDLSPVAIESMRQALTGIDADWVSRVRLHALPADDITGLPKAYFDTIVINSVAQCFPSADYLLQVLTKLAGLLAPQGAIFLGDIRNFALLREFHTGVQLAHYGGDDASELRRRIDRAIRDDKELLLAPEFFRAAVPRLDGIDGCRVRLKLGFGDTEMNRYRYDVVLTRGTHATPPLPAFESVPYADPAQVARALGGRDPQRDRITVTGVPQRGVIEDVLAVRALAAGEMPVGQSTGEGITASELSQLAIEFGFEVAVTPASAPGYMNASFCARTDSGLAIDDVGTLAREFADPATYASDPSATLDVVAVRRHLTEVLPEFMVPPVVLVLDRLPLTGNGKLDRAALPDPEWGSSAAYRAPTTDAERALSAIFADVLGVDRIGIDDSFFELGGHSLSAMRVLARVRTELGVELPVRLIFDAPTPAMLAARLHEGTTARAPLTRRERPELVPLSFAQQRLWFLHRLEGPSATYNMPFAVRLSGAVDTAALRAAFTDVVGRHEALRTIFAEVDGVGTQRVLPVESVRIPVEIVDAADPDTVSATLAAVAGHRFDLSAEIPLRATILDCGAGDFILGVVVHHIAGDGASMVPLVTDVLTAYAARSHGIAPVWTPLPVQYADYTLWQRDRLGTLDDPTSVIAEQVSYWRQELSELPEVIELPVDRPRPPVASHRGDTLGFTISATLRAGLERLARSRGVTVSMVTQAGLAAVLSRMGAGAEIAIGVPIAGRADEALTALVGFFVNTWVLRVDTSGDPEFGVLLARVKEKALAAYTHQDVPFEQLVSVLNPVRSAGHHPLFQVSLGFQNGPAADGDQLAVALPGLSLSSVEIPNRTARFDLWMNIDAAGPAERGYSASIEFATDLFDRDTVEALAARYVRVLERAVANADTRLSQLPVLDLAERALVLERWNATAVPIAGDATLVSLFEAQAAATPESTAIFSDRTALSYADLAARVRRLARWLIDQGVGPESTVALGMRRSPELVIGMYATLAAGGAFVPLDPDLPAERVEHIRRVARPVCVLTTEKDAARFPDAVALDGIDLSRYPDSAVSQGERNLPLRPANAAYVMFTSGSTGRPKGVMVSHEAIVNQQLWMAERYRVGAGDVYLQKTAASFDVSLWGYFLPLLVGAKLVLAAADDHRDPHRLAQLMARHSVTLTDFVPSVAAEFLSQATESNCMTLRELFLIGEALPVTVARRLRAITGAGVHNLYGPTEAAVSVTHYETSETDEVSVPIGRPEANTRVYVLDERLRPVAPGVAGELYLAGVQLARGYQRQPELTAARFVADPFGSGERLYRTGDVVRWLRSGELDYVGRTDFQVKVRGFRIELGEIEAVLATHPAVDQAAVIAREIPGVVGRQLLAYVVCRNETSGLPEELRDIVAAALPGYMVPAAVLVLDRFPVTVSGKLDRAALPDPDMTSGAAYRNPSTAAERALAGIFAEILGVGSVGADDSFFELGGHSLSAMRVLARVRAELGVELPVRFVFETPTVAGLAARLGEQESTDPFAAVLPIRTTGEQAPLWCIHPGTGVGWAYFGLATQITDRPIYAIQACGIDGAAPPAPSMRAMVNHYADHMLAVQPDGPFHLLGHSFGGTVAHSIAVELRRRGHAVASLTLLDSGPAVPYEIDRTAVEFSAAERDLRAAMEQWAHARTGDGDGSMVASVIDSLVPVSINNAEILAAHRSPVYDGDLVIFRAVRSPDGGRLDSLIPSWREFVDGDIEEHPIDATHEAIVERQGLSEVCAILRRQLATAIAD
ncbi:non-ribosomal peptide synthase/polyketide synthase [Nocardia sp. NPDC058058]|uniref:non-ribosomal peptide synthase/polyketide synthase n=1 Tax=Nocardia sp. NPDC058058 TaxID=3346317 RepID=UPI0036DDD55B